MNGKLFDLIKAHWWKIIVGIFMFYSAWVTLKADVRDTKQEMVNVRSDVSSLKEFRAGQIITNANTSEQLNKMDEKLDKILYRLPRR